MEAVKNDIRAHLKKVTEASAKQLTKATGNSESEVANALNSMRVYAEVECEQGGRGKGMMYWLTNAAAAGDDKVCCGAAKVMATTASQEVSELKKRIQELEADAKYREGILADYKKQFDEAREQLAAANALLMEGEEAIDIKDAASGYLVCAPKRKPAKVSKPESAVAKAKAAAKATGRSEVFALVSVGTATRKQIQAVEFKERAA